MISPVLVGREKELARLVALMATAPSVAVIEGEAGIGKSRLAAELLGDPAVAGMRVLRGACVQIREPFPLGPIVEALRGRATDLAGAELTPVAGALRDLLPELAGVLPEKPRLPDDRAAERHRIFRALAEVMAAFGPAVLVVEDLHWADEQTIEFLTYLMSVLPGALRVVLTYRGEEAPAAVRAITARTTDAIGVAHLVLPPLDAAQTQIMASAILEADHVTAEFAEHLCARASGLPLAVQELLALLRGRGALIKWEGGWARRALNELDVPSGVRVTVRERVAQLSDRAKEAAERAAVLRTPVPVEVLADADPGAIDEVLGSGLFAETDGAVGFRHVLAAQAVYEAIPPGRRQALHAAAADAVRRLRPVPLGRLAHHLRHAGRAEQWVETAIEAADQASRLGDDAEAARLLEDVLRNTELRAARRAELTVKLGWAALELLRPPPVADLISGALDQAAAERNVPRPLRGQLRLLLALHLERTRTDIARIGDAFAQAVDDLAGEPGLAAWAMVGVGRPPNDLPSGESKAWLERALATLPAVGDPAMRMLVLGKIAMIFVVIGDPRWAELSEDLVRETGGRGLSRREVNAYRSIGGAALFSGHHRRARRLLTAAIEDGAEPDLRGRLELRCLVNLAAADYFDGSWDGLAERLEELRDHFGDEPHERVLVTIVAACLGAVLGRQEAALPPLLDAIATAQSRGQFDDLVLPVTMLLRLATTRGEPEPAIATAAEAVSHWEASGLWPVAVRALPALTEALLSAGRPVEAADVIERYASRLAGLDAPLAGPALGHARGLLAAAEGRREEAAREFAAAAEAYEQVPALYEAAQAGEHAAACLFTLDDPAAVTHLGRAVMLYGRLHARWDLDRAAGLGRRWGVRPPAPAQNGNDQALSARQEQVARLAAEGLTNQEIAKELFLSPKTVDKHVSAAMRKVGARSRTELARRLPGS
ncbi:helix-turn-helix transcriptional regulator [Nonomuraea cavernae]|uniref:helix-turn-helix transcriptional regulator n=2 Tax=Nonomuraea cavernae TaxID=2045107 RepID=UPI001CD9E884|nr:LuxR family transcriptional regulator [Nonomuraea cavernae]MCA2185938.1 AAA family ATPase [Nonomuraea cavernae]